MAEGQKEAEKDLEKEITCIVCHEHYTDPKVLPCCHYYCKECIVKLSQTAGSGKPFPCPECRKDTTLPEGGVDSLPIAFFVNRMKAVHSKLVQAPPKQVSEKCEMCFEDEPEAFCQQCDKYICEDCIKPHRKMKALRDHDVKLLKKEGKSAPSSQEPAFLTCEKHAEGPLKFYCHDCNCLICELCTTVEHKTHRHQLLREASTCAKKKLIEQMQPLKIIGTSLSRAVKDVQATTSEVETQGDAVIEYIKSSFDEMYQIMKSREQALLAEATGKVVKKLKHLAVQEKSLSSSNVTVQAVLGFTEQCLKHFDDGNFMCLYTEIQSRLEKTLKEEGEEKCLVPVEVADIEVEINCIEKVKNLCENEAKVSQHAYSCIVSGKGIESAEVNNVAEFKVKFVRTAALAKQALKVECDLKSLKTGSIKQCEVIHVKDGECCIQYLPTIQGHHELALTVNSQPVDGSPISVPVSIHPTQIEKECRAAIAVNNPYGIAIDNASDEIIVAAGTTINVLDWSGKTLKVSDTREYGFDLYYYGVVVDNTNHIYATSIKTRLMKFTRSLKLVNTYVYLDSWFQGLTIVGDEVMVCDYNSCVKVFDKELKYVRSIGTYGTNTNQIKGVRDVSADSQQNIYVSDDKPGIHVFSNDGTYLRFFSVSAGELYGVFVTPQYVYIANNKKYSSGNLLVYTPEGELVATLGTFPASGVCVDKDGFAYVSEHGKSILHVF